jgi:hypothetical protein
VTTTHGKLQQAFGDDGMSRAQAFRWHKMFSEGRTVVEDEQRSGRPSATLTGDDTADGHQQHGQVTTQQAVRELVGSNRRLTVRMIADEINMNWETFCLTLTEEFGMRKFCTKMVSRNLRQQQWHARLSAFLDIRMHYGDAAASLLT